LASAAGEAKISGRRFGENGPGFGRDGQDGQDGRGWHHGHMHNLMNNDGDRDSQL
jgi:hypothetical protein